jgi:hypothetical protein
MKNILAISMVVVLILAAGCNSNPGSGKVSPGAMTADSGKAVLKFDTLLHDFGVVNEGEKIGYIFTFTNTGTANLLINSAATSCGCTVPKYDRKPLAPGAKGSLEVVFDTSGKSGQQTKTISVMSNAATPVVLLQIKAEVINTN